MYYIIQLSCICQEGTGLGLSIVKHSVNIHKGRIEISSVEGEWTKIIIGFPIVF